MGGWVGRGGGGRGEESFLIQAVPHSNIIISIDNQENAHLQLKKIFVTA